AAGGGVRQAGARAPGAPGPRGERRLGNGSPEPPKTFRVRHLRFGRGTTTAPQAAFIPAPESGALIWNVFGGRPVARSLGRCRWVGPLPPTWTVPRGCGPLPVAWRVPTPHLGVGVCGRCPYAPS